MAYIIRDNFEDKFANTEVHFEGSRDALNLFFKTTKAYPGTIIKASWFSGTVIPPEVIPKQVRVTKGKDIFDWLTVRGGGTLVSSGFKAAVIEIEPKQNQFIPVTVIDTNGAARPEEYFIFNVVGQIDSIVDSQSNFNASGRGTIQEWNYSRKVGPWKCALDSSLINGRACWIERHFRAHWFVSDRLAALLERRGLCGFSLDQHCDEISV